MQSKNDSADRPVHKEPRSLSISVSKPDAKHSMHRALLMPEIIRLIFTFVREFDEVPTDENFPSQPMIHSTPGKTALASLARTCRAFHEPAIDELWMHLEALDPLIKLLPRRMWGKKHVPPMIRMFMRKKHWLTFQKYASRVKSLRGPCYYRFATTVQRRVMAALASYPKATLPLLPNLKEITWCEIRMFHRMEPCVSLLRYFVGPAINSVTLKLYCWPYHISSETAVLAELSILCPNVTSFTAIFPPSSQNDPSQEVGAIVSNWSNIRTLRSCALPQTVMDKLISQRTLESLAIELNSSAYPPYAGHLPESLHTFALGGSSAAFCTRYLRNVYGYPSALALRIGVDDSNPDDINELFHILPDHLDKVALRTISVELTSSYWIARSSETFPLEFDILKPLLVFRSLRTVDLDLFSTGGLDDDAFSMMAQAWPSLESFALGTADVSRKHPKTTLRALISLLTHCPNLSDVRIVFDGTMNLTDTGDVHTGVVNTRITEISVGHSPLEDVNAMATCLGMLMPRLRSIVNVLWDRDYQDSIERWEEVQRMLESSLRSQGTNTD
ncbi:hypothetical protein V8B97DRAFT_1874426 [Scleroderma yunnanense]